jgi:hypothetical protein
MTIRTWGSTGLIAALLALPLAGSAMARTSLNGGHTNTFGTQPIPISMAPGGRPANGASGGAALSGDNRKTRLAAFHSDASNLVRGDTNGATDVFIWRRPHGRAGVSLSSPGGGPIRVSITSSGRQANGPSSHPSLDGSLRSAPHCVAFDSSASNMTPSDRDGTSDVFVRDLRRHRTILISRGIGAPAGGATIDGSCSRVAFTAGGRVFVARVKGGRPRSLGPGSQPDLSMDGTAMTWVSGTGAILLNRAGKTGVVARNGSNPRVSDKEYGVWGIVFDTTDRLKAGDANSSVDAYTRTMRARGGPAKTDLISAAGRGGRGFGQALNGGITAYGANRGIITFMVHEAQGDALYYRNNHTGNIDDLAYSPGGFGAIGEVATSARANFVAFTSSADISRYDHNRLPDVYFKHLVDGEAL